MGSPRSAPSADRLRIIAAAGPGDLATDMARDVERGVSLSPRRIPPRYFYDGRGCTLYEEISRTEEYYPTRVEMGILERWAPSAFRMIRPTQLVEVGAGPPAKASLLLGVLGAQRRSMTYVSIDQAGPSIREAAHHLLGSFPGLDVVGVVTDPDEFFALSLARPT